MERTPDSSMPQMSFKIGAVAERIGISERTLRYYEEFGLIKPSSHSRGGSRLYDEKVIARVDKIRTLQSLMGFNLYEIQEILAAEDHIDELRNRLNSDAKPKREVYIDAMDTLSELKQRVADKQKKLQDFQDELSIRLSRVKSKVNEFDH